MWWAVIALGCWRLVSTDTSPLHGGVTESVAGVSPGQESVSAAVPRLHLPEALAHLSGPRPPHPANTSTTPPPPAPPDTDEYYSAYAEYPEAILPPYNSTGFQEGGVLPEPGEVGEAEVALPEDSLADTDLHDHDLIDSVMYIYFGAASRDQGGPGRQDLITEADSSFRNVVRKVVIVGAVIALVAQFLTLASGLRRVKSQSEDAALLILLNTELALTISNLVFMLGVQATGDAGHCEMVAITLHYLHLVVCCWFFTNCLHVYRRLTLPTYRPRVLLYFLATWALPVAVVFVCTRLNRRGYESREYCWMSVERGMLYSFMIPVAILMLLNTVLAVIGLRLGKDQEVERKSLRVAASLLPLFAIVWFLGVIALENSASLVFPLLFLASNGFLNWFIFICWLPSDISAWRESEEDFDDEDEDLYEEQLKSQLDDQPLLQEVYVCGRRDDYDLQMDPICTISS